MRVIVAEDTGLYRDLLVHVLTSSGIEVVGQAGTADQAVALAVDRHPDVALLDIRMPPTYTDDGVRAALAIRARRPDTAVLLLSQYGEAEYAVQLVGALCHHVGYLLKERTATVHELTDAIERVAAGGVVVDPAVVTSLISRQRVASPLHGLTARELEALALMAEGHSNPAIALRMEIAVSTVEKYVTALFRKLDISAGGVGGRDNARVSAVLTYLRHTGRMYPRASVPG